MQEIIYQQAIETALIRLKQNGLKTYLAEYGQFCKNMAKIEGFRDLLTFQNVEDPLEILDIATWDNLENAQQADVNIHQKEEFKSIFSAMEKVIHFEHGFVHHQLESCDLDNETVLEFYVYNLKKEGLQEHLELKRDFMQVLQDEVPGFQRYVSMQSAKDPAVQIDLYFFKKTPDLQESNQRIEASTISKRFEAAMDGLSIYKTFQALKTDRQKLDLSKHDKAYYSSSKTAEIIELERHNYLAISGKGAPESDDFVESIPAIYTLAYGLKNHYQALGNDFVVPKMEAQWWVEGEKPFDQSTRDEWCWKIKIRLPHFVEEKVLLKVQSATLEKKKDGRVYRVEFDTELGGKAVQILHLGSYDHEQASIAAIMDLIKKEGFSIRDHHKEIYLTDPRKTQESKLRTIIRYAVE